MNVRLKIILVVLPLLLASMIILGTSSALSARSGITALAIEFMGFKAEALETYAGNQWNLLVNNDLQDREDLRRVTRQSIATHALEMTRTATELVFAVEGGAFTAFSTRPLERENLPVTEWEVMEQLHRERYRGWVDLQIDGTARVGYAFYFEPFDWLMVVTETGDSFFSSVDVIVRRTILITLAVLMVAAVLLVVFARFLTRPLARVVHAMDGIILNGDLSARVEVEFHDEIGKLAHTFNTMMIQLESSYAQVKSYALNAVLARKDEQKVRNIFQKYVPKDVIDTFFQNPESMLVGDNREVAILFTDIRKFTTISEAYSPDQLVAALNRYFSILVDIILDRNGIVDKYIGDALMAFFGAPVSHENDTMDAVESALLIADALESFNREQQEAGKPTFVTGLGINTGQVTVGNIGSDRKMDYTVIGDAVNLASRLEGLTKFYGQPLVFSEVVANRVKHRFSCRQVDAVIVKGKTTPEKIYTARWELTAAEKEGWAIHEDALALYMNRDFTGAEHGFRKVLSVLPDDTVAQLFLDRSRLLQTSPPDDNWSGAFTMETK